jgi:hypothetical protein
MWKLSIYVYWGRGREARGKNFKTGWILLRETIPQFVCPRQTFDFKLYIPKLSSWCIQRPPTPVISEPRTQSWFHFIFLFHKPGVWIHCVNWLDYFLPPPPQSLIRCIPRLRVWFNILFHTGESNSIVYSTLESDSTILIFCTTKSQIPCCILHRRVKNLCCIPQRWAWLHGTCV